MIFIQQILPYWSPNHRLLDTAYVLVEYNINEEMTELPELEHTVKEKYMKIITMIILCT